MGGPKYFFGGYASFTLESNIFGKLLTSNIILVILGEYPDPPIPNPPRPPLGGPYGGGPGGPNEGYDLMSLTPKCDIFLEMP